MKQFAIFLYLVVSLLPLLIYAQADTTASVGKAGITDVAESDSGLFMMMLLMLLAAGVSLFLLMIISAVFAGVVALMIAAGVFSISALMAWYKRSIYTGVRWFVYLSFAIIGVGAGLLAGIIIYQLRRDEITRSEMFMWCLPAGLIGGLATAWVVIKIGNLLYRKIANLR